ncbi:MAG TPA: class I SAM-dependent methyltransferase [Deltaproteobacteria bacterium]|nr:class I SAM-dependent methyltransferase [Deltaproteobacteria bacterium]
MSSPGSGRGTPRGFWNRLKARWYRRGMERSDFAEAALGVMAPRMERGWSVLDVGAGCGALCLALAEAGFEVTALEPAPAMYEILVEEKERRGLDGLETVRGAWGEIDAGGYDVIVCANVPELLGGGGDFLPAVDRAARRMVFLIASAGPGADKFYYRDLYPLIFNKPYPPRTDYLATYCALHELGICAGVEIIEYDFDQPFDDLDEAVEFWKEYMGIVTEEHDGKLAGYLRGRLEEADGGLVARFHKRSAVIYWSTDREDGRRKARR